MIKGADSLADYPLEQGRQVLLRLIHETRPQGSLRNDVTVVFDGKEDVWGHQPGGAVRVVFTLGQSADDYIKHAVESRQDRADIVVVTDDKGIIFYIRKLGARSMSVEEFFPALRLPAGRDDTRRDSGRGHKGIRPADQQKITRELEKIWLENPQDHGGDALQ